MCAAANTANQNQTKQTTSTKKERGKYNSSIQSLIDIWNTLAEYASPEKPLTPGEVASHLAEDYEKYASDQTIKRLLPDGADIINTICPHTVLREEGEGAVLLTYEHDHTLHVVLETPNGEPVWKGDMTAVLNISSHNPISYSTLTSTLPRIMREYDELKDSEQKEDHTESTPQKRYPPISLAGVVAHGKANGKTRYIPASSWEGLYVRKSNDINEKNPKSPTRRFFLESILSPAQWRILADLIMVYPYISEQETAKLLAAMDRLAPGMHSIKNWREIRTRYARKIKDAVNFDHIQKLDDAIREQCQVTVQYGKYRLIVDDDGQWKPRLQPLSVNCGRMVVDPYAMTWSNGYYYLICKDRKNIMRNLRVDRIIGVMPMNSKFEPDPMFNPCTYRDQSPVMYPGKAVPIYLRCHTSLLSTLMDFFGNAISSYSEPDQEGFTKVGLTASELGTRLFALQYADRVEILEPETLREEVGKTLLAAAQKYSQTDK